MKKGILFLLLLGSFFAQGQSLKEALFSGKLKNEPGTVIRKGDDLSSKIDTSTKRVAANTDSAKSSVATVAANNSSTANTPATQTAANPVATNNSTTANPTTTGNDVAQKPEATATPANNAAPSDSTATPAPAAEKPKDNTALFKEYMAGFKSTLESDVLPNKKLKKGSYYVQLTYVIGTDGQTTITDVYVDPENKFLQQQIADRLNTEMPKLNPVLNSNGTAHKVTKRYNLTLEKQ
jgi:CCR4-NOT transcriptional regulation complex NOT5 subunit